MVFFKIAPLVISLTLFLVSKYIFPISCQMVDVFTMLGDTHCIPLIYLPPTFSQRLACPLHIIIALLNPMRTGTYSTTEAIKAGLDLEMPGPSFMRGRFIDKALSCSKLSSHEVDACVRRVLEFIKKAMQLELEENAPEKGLREFF